MPNRPIIPRKTIEIDFQPREVADPEFTLNLPDGGLIRQATAATIKAFVAQIRVDGKTVITLDDIRTFAIENPHLFSEIEKRLELLEKILYQADAFGTVLVVREAPNEYSVAEPGSFTIMSADRDDD